MLDARMAEMRELVDQFSFTWFLRHARTTLREPKPTSALNLLLCYLIYPFTMYYVAVYSDFIWPKISGFG